MATLTEASCAPPDESQEQKNATISVTIPRNNAVVILHFRAAKEGASPNLSLQVGDIR